jgi:hypothetical protein
VAFSVSQRIQAEQAFSPEIVLAIENVNDGMFAQFRQAVGRNNSFGL